MSAFFAAKIGGGCGASRGQSRTLGYTVRAPAARAASELGDDSIDLRVAADAVGMGVVARMARPAGNVTGFVQGGYLLKQVEMLREAVQRLSRVAYLHHSNYPPVAQWLIDQVQRIGARIEILNVQDAKGASSGIEGEDQGVVREKNAMLHGHSPRIAHLAVRCRCRQSATHGGPQTRKDS